MTGPAVTTLRTVCGFLSLSLLVATGTNAFGQNAKPDAAKAPKADFTLTAQQFLDECKKDRTAADKKYKGKIIELSGVVGDFATTPTKDAIVWLKVEKAPGLMCNVRDKEPWTKVVPGQEVKVRGQYLSFGPGLANGIIVATGPNPLILIWAEDLAKQYATDRDALNAKFKDKYLMVEGEVAGKKPYGKTDGVHVFLKGTKDVTVCGLFGKDEAAGIQEGKKIKLFGSYLDVANPKQVELHMCWPISTAK
jgi:hypothetical protein